MTNTSIKILKQIGHELLEEYILLDMRRQGKEARNHAYEKLEKKLGENKSGHFSMMTTEDEVRRANSQLKKLIKRRRYKNQYYESHINKDEIAPNVIELQRLANNLNPHL